MSFVYEIIYPNAMFNVPHLAKHFLRGDFGHLVENSTLKPFSEDLFKKTS